MATEVVVSVIGEDAEYIAYSPEGEGSLQLSTRNDVGTWATGTIELSLDPDGTPVSVPCIIETKDGVPVVEINPSYLQDLLDAEEQPGAEAGTEPEAAATPESDVAVAASGPAVDMAYVSKLVGWLPKGFDGTAGFLYHRENQSIWLPVPVRLSQTAYKGEVKQAADGEVSFELTAHVHSREDGTPFTSDGPVELLVRVINEEPWAYVDEDVYADLYARMQNIPEGPPGEASEPESWLTQEHFTWLLDSLAQPSLEYRVGNLNGGDDEVQPTLVVDWSDPSSIKMLEHAPLPYVGNVQPFGWSIEKGLPVGVEQDQADQVAYERTTQQCTVVYVEDKKPPVRVEVAPDDVTAVVAAAASAAEDAAAATATDT